METLGLDWSEIHAEAEELEHAISEKVLEKLDEFLGVRVLILMVIPFRQREELLSNYHLKPLSDFEMDADLRIESIVDQDKKFLKFARKTKLVPGQRFKIIGKDDCADSITLRNSKGDQVSLGFRSAEKVLALPFES